MKNHFGLNQSRQQDLAYNIKHPGGENEYNERFFQNCMTIENKPYLDKYNIFTNFIIADNLPMAFSTKNKPVKEKLKQQKYINFTTDLWKSETNQYFMGITAHFADLKWEPQQVTTALKHMKGASQAGRLFMDVIEGYEIKSSLFRLTTDNTSYNGKLADYFENIAKTDPSFKFKRSKHLISCLAHAHRLTVNSEDDLREECSLNNIQIEYLQNIQKISTMFENVMSWLSSRQ
ncbi:hypothetical protein MFLAVUS_011231 [Mucor flavus]|uniref:Uncharacterized protein n=1 Tax=Mucor flavus TaxID=439312 RepID=A0ABP9ZEY7_9FUNG